jgi:hypothetical protein
MAATLTFSPIEGTASWRTRQWLCEIIDQGVHNFNAPFIAKSISARTRGGISFARLIRVVAILRRRAETNNG